MKTGTGIAIGLGAVALIGGGAYFVLKSRKPPEKTENADFAAMQSMIGARAAASLPLANQAVVKSVQEQAKKVGLVGNVANQYLPGSGAIADKAASTVVAGIKKLKFW